MNSTKFDEEKKLENILKCNGPLNDSRDFQKKSWRLISLQLIFNNFHSFPKPTKMALILKLVTYIFF